jgi:hypothetical protein
MNGDALERLRKATDELGANPSEATARGFTIEARSAWAFLYHRVLATQNPQNRDTYVFDALLAQAQPVLEGLVAENPGASLRRYLQRLTWHRRLVERLHSRGIEDLDEAIKQTLHSLETKGELSCQ